MIHAIHKQMSKPFQLIKSYYLFQDEEESSIEVDYKHMRYDMEIIAENIRSTCTLLRKKQLMSGFISIKHFYEKKVKYENVYLNMNNMMHLTSTITMVQHSFQRLLSWEGFGALYFNLRGENMSTIGGISGIDVNNQHNDL